VAFLRFFFGLFGGMSIKQILSVTRRLQFVKLALKAQASMAQLCRMFGLSRKSGYKWKARFERDGVGGLQDRSRRPVRSPRQISHKWLARIRWLRRYHRTWGSRKLAARLRKDYGKRGAPSARTVGKWLRRLKLSRRQARNKRPLPGPALPRVVLTQPVRSNQVWTVDFKGWFRTRDGQRVDPLTVRDLFSRYLLAVHLLKRQTWEPARRVFLRLFRRYGYPVAIRVDNGSPFGSTGAAGLSRLSAWWTALGIRVEFIAPGHPEQNGAHEQMHRVLKAEITRPASRHQRAQQRRADRWARQYNYHRPHEALQQRVPAEIYRPKREPLRTVQLHYGRGWIERRVRSNGEIRWRGRKRFVGEAFIGYRVGVKPLTKSKAAIYFGSLLIGEIWESDSGGMRPIRYEKGSGRVD
jgi:transposase InsO family protein